MLSRLRTLVKEADPEVVEEWKWRGVPVGSHDGMIFTGETYKNVVKMTFAKGAALKDPSGAEPRSEHRAERPRRRLAVLRAGRQTRPSTRTRSTLETLVGAGATRTGNSLRCLVGPRTSVGANRAGQLDLPQRE
jgi:Domain of unknown function (DU1801)